MSKKKEKADNLKIAKLFILLVFGLIFLSALLKTFFLFKQSKFDGLHKINVAFISKETTNVASFSPQGKSISILQMNGEEKGSNLSKFLQVPIDGQIKTNKSINEKNISSALFKTFFTFGSSFKDLTIIDILRVFLFTRSVSANSIYVRDFSPSLNNSQKLTLISLTFIDPSIYQENQSIEIVNATNIFGLGSRLATLVTNIGGNVILVSSPNSVNNKSKIVYSGDKTYTVKKLGGVLGFPLEKAEKKGIADVIIIIGTDKVSKINF